MFEEIVLRAGNPSKHIHEPSPSELSVGKIIWENWARISYQIFESCLEDNSTSSNTWLCVPQLISTLSCLVSVAGNVSAESIRCELMAQQQNVVEPAMIRILLNQVGDELRQWENALHSAAKPGSFAILRRVLIHPKFTKSYSYSTFLTLNNLGIEVKIFENTSELIQWMQKHLKASFIRTCPFEIWKDGDTSMKEVRTPSEHAGCEILQIKSNQKCPILAWTSHFQIAFKSGLLNSETVFSHAGQNNNEDDLLVKFHNDNAKMRQCHLGKTSVLEIPTNSPSISLYFITGIEKSMAGQQLMELIHSVKKKKPNVKTAFIPLWWPHEKATNMAKGIKNTLDAESLFSHGGFGDLAMADAEASADYTRKLTSNAQHFDMVTVLHSPDINNVRRIELSLSSPKPIIIKCPFTLVVYDDYKKMPIYFGNITHAKLAERKADIENEMQLVPKSFCRLL